MSTIDEAQPTGLTTRSRSGSAFPFDLSSTALTSLQPNPRGWSSMRGLESLTGRPQRFLSIQITDGDTPTMSLAVVLERRLNELLVMRAGWNAGRGAELADAAVKVAVPMVFGILGNRTLAPQLFPLSDGGLQFEWHVGGNSIEVEVEPDGSAFAMAEARDQGIVIEEDVDNSTLTKLREFLEQIVTAA